jgi:hypothetical protein
MLKTLTISVLGALLILSCKQKSSTTKFLGNWENIKDSTNSCIISQSGDNFIFEYSHSTFYNQIDDEMILAGNQKVPAFYDKTNDKLIIKWKKELDAVFDNNSNQLIIESWGAYKKIN